MSDLLQRAGKGDWAYWGQWVQPTLSGVFWSYWHQGRTVKELVPNHTFDTLLYLNGHMWMRAADKAFMGRYVADLLERDGAASLYDVSERAFKKSENELLAVSSMQDLPTFEYLKKLFDAYTEVASVWTWITYLGDELGAYLLENGQFPSEEAMLAAVEPFHIETWLERQGREVRELAKVAVALGLGQIDAVTAEVHPELYKRIPVHTDDFAWFGTHHWEGEPYTHEKAVLQINEEIARGRDQKVREPQVPSDPVVRLLVQATYWRTHCAEVCAKVVYESRGVLEAAAGELGLTYEQLVYLSGNEILQALAEPGHADNLLEKVAERYEGYGCLVDGDDEIIVTGARLQTELTKLLDLHEENVAEVKGSPATKKPAVTGRVRIILSPRDFAKFEKGSVLVVPETTPDFVPLMRQAAAVVTDKGGITSHAAIVARELGIPCVIGTKHATAVFKNGDTVEVSTETGVVRRIDK